MDTEREIRIIELFKEVRDYRPMERAAILNQRTKDDPSLRNDVERLLAIYDAPPETKLPPLIIAGALSKLADSTPLPDAIGPYKVISLLGEGGMGVVYLAEQEKPLHRRVALKVIKLGMDTKGVVARFESEREALALMSHANVAKVFDAGATEDGRPFFVMEYVPGLPITRYCDEKKLSTEKRLQLFSDVCAAVQHAHQKGIIHRDIKPSNVLVAEVDGKAAVKVIDFGIAKATQQGLTEETFVTATGNFVGTPAYMSPEQAGVTLGEAADIDTRADVYSLGVLLYELLVGVLPFDPARLRQAAFSEIQRIIREVDPPKPSTRLVGMRAEPRASARAALQNDVDTWKSTASLPAKVHTTHAEIAQAKGSGSDMATIAGLRSTAPTALLKQLRGDLDWVVMKCLEKDRNRRYETVNALVMEIQRYLNYEPVAAGPPSAMYRLKKFVRRNGVAVAAGSSVLLALSIGLVGTFSMYTRAERQRERAETALIGEAEQRRAAEQERDTARKERDKTEKFADFMQETLKGVGPSVALGRDTTMLKELMDAIAQRIGDGELLNTPEAEVKLRLTIGFVYREIGELSVAEKVLIPALELAKRVYGNDSEELASAMDEYANSIAAVGRYAEALPLYEQTHALLEQLFHGDHASKATSLNNYAVCLQSLGRLDEALLKFEEALAIKKRLFPPRDSQLAGTLANIAGCLDAMGRSSDSLPKHEEALETLQKNFPGDHPDVATVLNNLATCLTELGRWDEALPRYEQSLAMRRRLFPEGHPDIASGLNNLASCLNDLGRPGEALPLYQEALLMRQQLFPGDNPDVAASLNNVAYCLDSLDRHADALLMKENGLAMLQRLYPDGHPEVATGLNNMASSLSSLNRFSEALGNYEKALITYKRFFPSDHPHTANCLNSIGRCLEKLNRPGEALPLHEEALAMFQRLIPGDHPRVAASLNAVGVVLVTLGRPGEALPRIEEALSMCKRALPNDNLWVAMILEDHGRCLESLERTSDALLSFEERISMLSRLYPNETWRIRLAETSKGRALMNLRRYEEGKNFLLAGWDAIAFRTEVSKQDKVQCLKALTQVFDALESAKPGQGHAAETEKYRALLQSLEAQAQSASP